MIWAVILKPRISPQQQKWRNEMIIAIDGPAASGKGTLARKLAQHMNYPYMDTGKLYRAAAFELLDEG